MRMAKLLACVTPMILSALVSQMANVKTASGVDNPYKYEKFRERFQNSSFRRYQNALKQSFDGLEQKTDNLEVMNQNLEGKVGVLTSEKDKLNKAYALMKTKQSALEKEQTKLKSKATSLEVAYKKLSNKVTAASASKKPKTTAKKTAAKAPSKSSPKKSKSTGAKEAKPKFPISQNKEELPQGIKPYPPASAAGKTADNQRENANGNVDVKKINEKGIEYGKKGMYDDAIREFQKAAAIEPNMANVHYNLGLAYKKKGMLAESEKEFSEYERLKGQGN